jgi:hypothetical protein
MAVCSYFALPVGVARHVTLGVLIVIVLMKAVWGTMGSAVKTAW